LKSDTLVHKEGRNLGADSYLTSKTDNLFGMTNRIFLYDLTNFYWESPKRNSKKAKFGRSKEKRYDCKLLCLPCA